MKRSAVLAAAFSLLIASGLAAPPASAQDPVKVAPSTYKVLLENDHVRVLDVRLKRGKKSPMHSHPTYIAYMLADIQVRFTGPDGKTADVETPEGQAVWRDAETHSAENIGSSELHVLNFELKDPAPPLPPAPMDAPDPLEVSPEHYDVLLENDRVRVMVVSDKPGEKWGAHRHPARVIYALTPFKLQFTYPDGRTERAQGKAGTAMWADPVVHVGENIGKGPSRVLLVEFKSPAPDPMGVLNIPAEQMKWQTIIPELGEGSPEIAILRVDPKTQATELMIRSRRAMHVPLHWHSANETHTVVSGRFLMGCKGHRTLLGPGGFNYMPAREHHEAWLEPEPGGNPFTVFITVDGAWDVNWVSGPPTVVDLDVPMPAAH